jgi:cyclophilin family peptidyl-prolyl cis-trans isomerase
VELFEGGYYDHSHFFRVVPNFLVQFGISYTTDVELNEWGQSEFLDDPPHVPKIRFEEGTISYAGKRDFEIKKKH